MNTIDRNHLKNWLSRLRDDIEEYNASKDIKTYYANEEVNKPLKKFGLQEGEPFLYLIEAKDECEASVQPAIVPCAPPIWTPPTPVKNPLNPLAYQQNRVDFLGRGDELKRLDAFLNSKDNFLWWAVLGEGGVGKSRLALEWLKELNEGKARIYQDRFQSSFYHRRRRGFMASK